MLFGAPPLNIGYGLFYYNDLQLSLCVINLSILSYSTYLERDLNPQRLGYEPSPLASWGIQAYLVSLRRIERLSQD